MSDKAKESKADSVADAHNPFFADAYNFCADTIANPTGRLRQADITIAGTALGGLKQVPNQFVNHPWETAGKLATAAVAGAAFSAAAASESPLIAGGAIGIGVIGMGAALLDTCTRLGKIGKFRHALDAVYDSDNPATELKALEEVADVAGAEGFDYGIAIAGSVGAIDGPKAWHDIRINRLAHKLESSFQIPKALPSGAVDIKFRDGCVLHTHGDQAIIRIAGAEHNLHVYTPALSQGSPKIGLKVLDNALGRLVLKGRYAGSLDRFEIDIDPDKGITTVKSKRLNRQYKHSDLAAWKPFFQRQHTICEECNAQKNLSDKYDNHYDFLMNEYKDEIDGE